MNSVTQHIITFFFLLCGLSSLCQNKKGKADIENVTSSNDTVRLNEYLDLYREYENKDIDKSLVYALEAKKLALKLRDPSLMASMYMTLGLAYSNHSKTEQAFQCFLNSRNLYEKLGDDEHATDAIFNIAVLYADEGLYDDALRYYYPVLNLFLKYADTSGAGLCCENMSLLYEEMGLKDSAVLYTKKALEYYTKANDREGIAGAKQQMGMNEMDNKEYSKAIALLLESEKLYLSEQYYSNLVYPYIYLTECFNKTGNLKEAEKYAHKALETARITNRIDLLQTAYSNMAEVAKEKNDFKTAYEFLSRGDSAATEIFERSHFDASDIKSAFERKVKEEEVKLQKIRSEKATRSEEQKRLIYLFATLLVVACSLSIFSKYKAKAKSEKRLSDLNEELNQQNEEIAAQRDELEMQKKIVEGKNKDITDSIRYAKRIQDAILVPESMLQELFTDSFILFKPKEILSGDFYWFEKVEEKIYLFAADCTGHGVPGAFLSTVCFNLVKQAIHRHKKQTPAEILAQLQKDIKDSIRSNAKQANVNDSVDIAVCCIDTEKKQVIYSGANFPIILIRSGGNGLKAETLTELKSARLPIGKDAKGEDGVFSDDLLHFQKGDYIYLATDGFTDQFGGSENKKLKHAKFRKMLLEISKEKSAVQKQRLAEEFEKYKSDNEQIDDVLILGIRIQ